MGPFRHFTTLIKCRINSIRKHKDIFFLTVRDSQDYESKQLLVVDKNVQSSIGPRGSHIVAEIAQCGTDLVLRSLLQQHMPEAARDMSRLSLEKLRETPHLRVANHKFTEILRFRSHLLFSLRRILGDMGLIEIGCPVLTTSDCEGTSELFKIENSKGFFNADVFLSGSAQFHLEAAVSCFPGVFSLSQAFRSEKHDSKRHLSEFSMLEVEISYLSRLDHLMDFCEHLVKRLINCRLDYTDIPIADSSSTVLRSILDERFARVSYSEALSILGRELDREYKWGHHFSSLEECLLCKAHGEKPVFVTHYPKSLKPFYMYSELSAEGLEVASCFDLLIPKMAELVGGSFREHRAEQLKSNMRERNIDQGRLQWYTDLRTHGNPCSSGFGLGFERLLALLLEMENVRDLVLFPRANGTCKA